MSRAHVLTPSWTSGAVATSNGAATPDTDADKLLQVQTSRKFRSSADNNIRLTFDTFTAKPADTVFIGAHNGIAADTVTVTFHNSTGSLYTTPSFSYGPVSLVFPGVLTPFLERDIIIPLGATPNYRYMGIEIDAPTNPDNYFEAGVVMAGEAFEPDIGMEPGWQFGANDPSEQQRSLNGEAIVRAKRKYRVWSGTFPKQHQADAARWQAINEIYGNSIPVVAWWEPPVAGYQQYYLVYGHMQWPSGGGITFSHFSGLYDVKFEVHGV